MPQLTLTVLRLLIINEIGDLPTERAEYFIFVSESDVHPQLWLTKDSFGAKDLSTDSDIRRSSLQIRQ